MHIPVRERSPCFSSEMSGENKQGKARQSCVFGQFSSRGLIGNRIQSCIFRVMDCRDVFVWLDGSSRFIGSKRSGDQVGSGFIDNQSIRDAGVAQGSIDTPCYMPSRGRGQSLLGMETGCMIHRKIHNP